MHRTYAVHLPRSIRLKLQSRSKPARLEKGSGAEGNHDAREDDGEDQRERRLLIRLRPAKDLQHFHDSRQRKHQEERSDCLIPQYPRRPHHLRNNRSGECLGVMWPNRTDKSECFVQLVHDLMLTRLLGQAKPVQSDSRSLEQSKICKSFVNALPWVNKCHTLICVPVPGT